MKRVDYTVNHPVQIRIRVAELLDFIDRVENSGVMFSAELAADLG